MVDVARSRSGGPAWSGSRRQVAWRGLIWGYYIARLGAWEEGLGKEAEVGHPVWSRVFVQDATSLQASIMSPARGTVTPGCPSESK